MVIGDAVAVGIICGGEDVAVKVPEELGVDLERLRE